MSVLIKGIEYFLPECIVTNNDLHEENPNWEMASIEAKSGVSQRHIARDDETALDLAKRACDRMFSQARYDKSMIDAVIFCTQSPDYLMPSNAFLIHDYLDLPDNVLAFDINLACSGYVYGLTLARALIVAQTASNVLLVTGDTYSKYINKRDRSARVLFGDGASVSWIQSAAYGKGIQDTLLASSGKNFAKFYIPGGACRMPATEDTRKETADESGNIRSKHDIHMDGLGVWRFIQSTVPIQIRRLLERNSLSKDDIDLYVFHQASKMTIDSLTKALRLNTEKVYMDISNIGNTVSTSIPIALKDAMSAGRITEGSRVLISGFGVGLSWGTMIMVF